MPIVEDKARAGAPVPGGTSPTDPSYDSYDRANAGEPNGSLTPAYAGEIVLDTTNNCAWKALGLTNTSWVALTPPN